MACTGSRDEFAHPPAPLTAAARIAPRPATPLVQALLPYYGLAYSVTVWSALMQASSPGGSLAHGGKGRLQPPNRGSRTSCSWVPGLPLAAATRSDLLRSSSFPRVSWQVAATKMSHKFATLCRE